ncbi:uncharacterized protein TNCV_59511 [Trichonephila clavipes]|nr:uncharacterized protein TNCV_59511 [Trichonephila clavipes]
MSAISLDFLIRYEEEGDDMLSRIVTGDETWISHITPELKQQSMEWQHTSSPFKDVLDHAPCSPDLAPSNFYLFWYLKHSFGGKCFSDNEEVKAAVNSWLSDRVEDFFEEGIQNLVLRCDKCIDKLGNYVVK